MRRGHKYSDTDPLRDPVTGQINPVEFKRRLKGWLAVALAFAVLLGGAGFVASKGYEAYTAFKTQKEFAGPGGTEVQLVKVAVGFDDFGVFCGVVTHGVTSRNTSV